MGICIVTCPHCLTADIAAQVIGSHVYRRGSSHTAEDLWMAVGAICRRCSKPIALIVEPYDELTKFPEQFDKACRHFNGESSASEVHRLRVTHIWPTLPEPEIPAHVPHAVERAMLQAERNYPVAGNEEAAGLMYRRTLELALKAKFPTLTGSLASRIKKLVADKTLTEAMGDWADEIRDLGNDAAHDVGEIDRDQLRMIRGFTDATLRYLYTLPAEVAARRKLP